MTTDTQTLPVASRKSGFRWRRFVVAFLITFGVLLALVAAGVYAYASSNDGHILSGVSIGGVSVAGETPAAAKQKLLAQLPDVSSGSLTVQAGSVNKKISYSDIGRSYDLDTAINQAMQVGRQGNPLDQISQQLHTMTDGVSITPTVGYDAQALQQKVAAIVASAQSTPVDAQISFQNGAYVLTASSDGQQVDGAAVLREAVAALNNSSVADTSLDVPATSVSASIQTPEAQAALDKLQSVVSTPLLLTVGATSYTIDPQTLRGWVHLDNTAPGQWSVVLDHGPIDQLVATLKTQVDKPAVDATFVFQNGQPVATPAQTGYDLDAATSSDAIYNALIGRASGTAANQLTLAVTATPPTLTTDQAQALVAKVQILGQWTTNYIPSSFNNQGINIRRPTDLINGTVVQPGAVFSFVGTAGPITVANGYGDGAAIIHGKTKGEGVLGGGLCSASTTLYNAALRAGFELGARRNHAYYITRYPVGLDATIWISGGYTQDMSFTNDSSYPILIRGINKKRSVTYEIWGVPDGRTVTLSTPTITNQQTAQTYYEWSDDLAPRTTKQVEFTAPGFDAVVIRTVKDANGSIIHQDTISSSYRNVNGIILVGRLPGDPPAGTEWPVSEGIPPPPTTKPTPSPTASSGGTKTPKPSQSTQPTDTPSPTASASGG